MPKKIAEYRSHGEKLISLFAKLLFSRERHSLTDLARGLSCSKQTVLRYVEDIQRSYGVEIEESIENRRKYFSIKRHIPPPAISISNTELTALYMCHAFTEHLLGKKNFEASTRALEKSLILHANEKGSSSQHFASFRPGCIDYTPFHDTIQKLIEAMNNKRICKVSYQAVTTKQPKTFYIQPFKIFSHKESLYLHAHKTRGPAEKYSEFEFDPLLAIHRIKAVKLTDRCFCMPDNYNFDKFYNENFGVMKGEAFQAIVEFDSNAADYVSERIWSPDQTIKKLSNGNIRITLTTTSEPELISWVLSFGKMAKLLAPADLIEEIRHIIQSTAALYS